MNAKKLYSIGAFALVAIFLDVGLAQSAFCQSFSYTSIFDPSAAVLPYAAGGTSPAGISNGVIYGNFLNNAPGSSGSFGFTYSGGIWNTISKPDGGYNITFATGVQGATVAGFYFQPFIVHGYSENDGVFTTYDAPGFSSTYVYGISGSDLVGTVTNGADPYFGFILDTTTDAWNFFEEPNASEETIVRGIDENVLYGYYVDATSGVTKGFLEDTTDDAFSTISVPGASSTYVFGYADGIAVGSYENASGNHGFLLDGGVFSVIDVPGGDSGSTTVTGVESGPDGLTIVGIEAIAGVDYGFVGTQSVTDLPAPKTYVFVLAAVLLGGSIVRRRHFFLGHVGLCPSLTDSRDESRLRS
jgi:hypothetical protein